MTDIDGEPDARLTETFTSPYPADDQSTEWNALIAALAAQFKDLESVRDEVLASKFVTDATGKQLEKLASIFQVERETGESDDTYRLRIQAALRSQLSSGTVEDVKEASAVLLDTDSNNIAIQEPYDSDGIILEVGALESDLNNVSITASEFAEFIDDVAASGVDTTAFLRGTFRFTANSSPVTSDDGFQELDSNDDPIEGTGGTWPELIN